MISLYTMLFNDKRYDEKDSIVFDWNPLFFGMGAERYTYDRMTLQETILKEMGRENWMGACCEPNLVFIVCNQFPVRLPKNPAFIILIDRFQLIAMRYNDVTNGTDVIGDVLPKYKAAWERRGGMMAENGLFKRYYSVKRDECSVTDEISHSAW